MKVKQQICRWHCQADLSRLVNDLRDALGECANQAINLRGVFTIVLAGGSTPKAVYQLLPELCTDWSRWQIYFGDERCLPIGHPDRNDSMVFDSWLSKIPISNEQIHTISAEQFARAAQDYSLLLEAVDYFDLVLLGIGEDGHTASLFSGDQTGISTTFNAVFIENSPKPPAARISLTAQRLSRANAVWCLATGSGKHEILHRWFEGEDLPVTKIMPQAGIDIFTDQSISCFIR